MQKLWLYSVRIAKLVAFSRAYVYRIISCGVRGAYSALQAVYNKCAKSAAWTLLCAPALCFSSLSPSVIWQIQPLNSTLLSPDKPKQPNQCLSDGPIGPGPGSDTPLTLCEEVAPFGKVWEPAPLIASIPIDFCLVVIRSNWAQPVSELSVHTHSSVYTHTAQCTHTQHSVHRALNTNSTKKALSK